MTTCLPGHKTTYVSVTPVELIRDPDGRRVYVPGAGTPSIHNYATQAQRCPHCNALVAVGDSFKDHTFWCKRVPYREPGLSMTPAAITGRYYYNMNKLRKAAEMRGNP